MKTDKKYMLDYLQELQSILEEKDDIKTCIGILVNEEGGVLPNAIGRFTISDINRAIIGLIDRVSAESQLSTEEIIFSLVSTLAEVVAIED